jgi:3-dehydroquinate dehydratase-2
VTDTILVLNGPNLGRLGSREPEVYGNATLADIGVQLEASTPEDVVIELRQTDDEGELIRWLHEAVERRVPVVLNPAAFTHYSYGLRDAAAQLKQAGVPLVEVHLTNPHAREAFRHTSVISAVASGVIAGFGADSYRLAVDWLLRARG